jgi:glycosyltransferase involved in cell wall biosynthesis
MRHVVSEERALTLVAHRVAAPLDILGLPKPDPEKKTLCFYYHHINAIGGVEIAMLNLIKKLHESYNIIIAFSADTSDPHMLCRLAEYSNQVVNLNHSDHGVRCDLLLVCSIYCILCRRITYTHAFRWVHGSVKEMGLRNPAEIMINGQMPEKVICVSNESSRQFEEVFQIPAQTIHNIVDYDEIRRLAQSNPVEYDGSVLNLVTVSRISREKGFERMVKMAEMLEAGNIQYHWRVIGSGYDKAYEAAIKKQFSIYPNVEFLGPLDNPFTDMIQSDYLVLLSDYEAYALVVVEALALGTPCILTDFQVAHEILGSNGFIVKKDMSNLDVNRLLPRIEVQCDLPDDLMVWNDLLATI